MQVFLITFILSLLLSALIVVLAKKRHWFLSDHDLQGVQKFHHKPTPHVGGLAVFLSFSVGSFLLPNLKEVLLPLLFISAPVFIIGLIEDLSAKISPLWRLLVIFFSLSVAFLYLDIGVSSLNFMWIDKFLSYTIVGLAFTLLVVGGAINSLNVVDGYNGLMSGYILMASLAMAVVAHQLGDHLILQLNVLLMTATFGFFLLNFPWGKLFMGDGGAYFIGFIFSMIGLLFASRHESLSNWFVLAILMYPMFELLFSIYRKKILNNTPASQPDSHHLHMLVYKWLISKNPNGEKNLNNSMTSPFLWALSLFSIVPAVFLYNNKIGLIILSCMFMAIYILFYRWIANRS